MCCEITPTAQISLRSLFEWAGLKVRGLVTFLLLLTLMDPHRIFLYNLLQTEQAVGHMSSSPEVYPWCSQVICPMWIRLPAVQLPREVWDPLKSLRPATVTKCKVEIEKGQLRARGCRRSPAVSSKRGPRQLWLSRDVNRIVWATQSNLNKPRCRIRLPTFF